MYNVVFLDLFLIFCLPTKTYKGKPSNKKLDTKIIFRLSDEIKNVITGLLKTVEEVSKPFVKLNLVESLNNELQYLVSILLGILNQPTGKQTDAIAMMITRYFRDVDSILKVLSESHEDTNKGKTSIITKLVDQIENEEQGIIDGLLVILNGTTIPGTPIIREVIEDLKTVLDSVLDELLGIMHDPTNEQQKIITKIVNRVNSEIRLLQNTVVSVTPNFPGRELNLLQDGLSDLVEEILGTIDGTRHLKTRSIRMNLRGIHNSFNKFVNRLLTPANRRVIDSTKIIIDPLRDEIKRLTNDLIEIVNESADAKTKRMIGKYLYQVNHGLNDIIRGLMNIENNRSIDSKLKDIKSAIHLLNENIRSLKQELLDQSEEREVTITMTKPVEKEINTFIKVILDRMKIKRTRKGKHVITLVTMLNDDVKKLIDSLKININVSSDTRAHEIDRITDRINDNIETLTQTLLKIANDIKNLKERNVITESIKRVNKELHLMIQRLLDTVEEFPGSRINAMKKIIDKVHDGIQSLTKTLERNIKDNGRELANKVATTIYKFVEILLDHVKIIGTTESNHIVSLVTKLTDDIEKLLVASTMNRNASNSTREGDIIRLTERINEEIDTLTKALLMIANKISNIEERNALVRSTEILEKELEEMVQCLLDTKEESPESKMKTITKITNKLHNEIKTLTNTLARKLKGNDTRNTKLTDQLHNEIKNLIIAILYHMDLTETDTERHVLLLVNQLNEEVKRLTYILTEKHINNVTKRKRMSAIVPRINVEIEDLAEALLRIANDSTNKKTRESFVRVIHKLQDKLKKLLHAFLRTAVESSRTKRNDISNIIGDISDEIKILTNTIVATTIGESDGRTKDLLTELHDKLDRLIKELLRTMKVKRSTKTMAITEIVKRLNEQIKNLVKQLLKTTDKNGRSRSKSMSNVIDHFKDNIKALEVALLAITDVSASINSHLVKNIVYRLMDELKDLVKALSGTINEPARKKVNKILKIVSGVNNRIKELDNILLQMTNQIVNKKIEKKMSNEMKSIMKSLLRNINNHRGEEEDRRRTNEEDIITTAPYERESLMTGPTEYTSLARIFQSSSRKTVTPMVSIWSHLICTWLWFKV